MRQLLAILLFLISAPAFAQSPGMPYTYPVTIGTSSSQVIGTNTNRKRIEFVNPNATALIAVCPTISRTTVPTITCAVNGAGSITLLPYASYRVDGVGNIPQVNSAWNGIASTPGAALTVFEWE